jgi:hypothetical protein
MPGIKTNSNSITAILINKLNNKKSGFRFAMLEKWELPTNTIFKNGTHSTITFSEMENKEVDIVGMSGTEYVILIEIKANLSENIQESQKANGQYVKTAQKHNLKLKYIIPDGYYEFDKLPLENDFTQIIKWSQIYEIAQATDNTGFTDDINNFVESSFSTNDILLNKGEIAMFLSPNEIKNVITLESKLEELIIQYAQSRKYIRGKKEGWGNWFTINYNNREKQIWIGLYNLEEASDKYLFMWEGNVKLFTPNKFKDKLDYWLYNSEIYIPILDEKNKVPDFLFAEKAEEQQELFNQLMDYNIKKYFEIVE